MPWQLRFIDRDQESDTFEPYQVGDCYYARYLVDNPEYANYWASRVSPEYLRDWADKRPPIVIHLPGAEGGLHWIVDIKASTGDSGWTVTGEVPNLTIRPSIMMTGYYHGFITDGVISDDLEGKQYEENGKLIR